jgi:hypothetical protein
MTEQEKDRLCWKEVANFMESVLNGLYPSIEEYPFEEMDRVRNKYGKEFENTEFAFLTKLQQAFYMRENIIKIMLLKETE